MTSTDAQIRALLSDGDGPARMLGLVLFGPTVRAAACWGQW